MFERAARRSRWTTGQRRVLATVALAISVLTGCRVDAAISVEIDPSGGGTVTVDVVADGEILAEAPDLVADLRLADLEPAGWVVDDPVPQPDGGMRLVLRRPFTTAEEATAILGQLSGSNGPFNQLTLTQQRAFARVTTTFTGSIRLSDGLASFVDAGVLAALEGTPYEQAMAERSLTLDEVLGVQIRVLAPGWLESSNGSPAGPEVSLAPDTAMVSWTADLAGAAVTETGQSVSAETLLADEGARTARRWRDFAPWAAAAWVAFVAGVITPLVVLVGRYRRRRARGV